ncbi:hypothetical protein [Haloarchaeobius iranensis]|uniref:Uncharacterized protein n=1 Tax=Haloarchaeobius iranensis TaxID=996166 RepID=A0A1G9WHJ4_9EURY|nr:hypothetical protein [Haloarchaeobius iranensis]SDM83919.1 hypothetical protein SAMN05192554_10874 [Haloarchaeobius iranensis]
MVSGSSVKQVSRRRLFGILGTTTIGTGTGCLSGRPDLDRDISLAFVRLVNQSREYEREFSIELTYDGGTVLDRKYGEIPPARAPMNILTTTGGSIHYGVLPGGTGVDTDRWHEQLIEAHTITIEDRNRIDSYALEAHLSPPEVVGEFSLWDEINRAENNRRQINDNSLVGISIGMTSSSLSTDYHVFESAEEKALLDEFVEAEQLRQGSRDEYGEDTVDDSAYT